MNKNVVFQFIINLKKAIPKANLVLVQKQVIRGGKIHTQGFWVSPEDAKNMDRSKDKPFDYDEFLRLSKDKEDRPRAIQYLKDHGITWDEVSHGQQNWLKAQKAAADFIGSGTDVQEPPDKKEAPKLVTPIPKKDVSPVPGPDFDPKKEADKLFWNLVKNMGKEKLIETMKAKGVKWNGNNWLTIVSACKAYLADKLEEDWKNKQTSPKTDPVPDPVKPDPVPVPVKPDPVKPKEDKPDSSTITINGEKYKLTPEFLAAYNDIIDKNNPKTIADKATILAYNTIMKGVSPADFHNKLTWAYDTMRKVTKMNFTRDEAEKRQKEVFGAANPSYDLVDVFYRANDMLRKTALQKIDNFGREVIRDFDIKSVKNSKGQECWAVIDNVPMTTFPIKKELSELGANWDKTNRFWYFPRVTAQEKINNILEVFKYGNGSADKLIGNSAVTNGGGQFTGLDSRVPLRGVQDGAYGKIIPTRGRVFTGDGKLNPSFSRILRPHQLDGVNLAIEAVDSYGGFLLSDGTGAGKTMQELAIASHYLERGNTVAIVTPNTGVMVTAFGEDASILGVGDKLVALTNDDVGGIPKKPNFKLEKGRINLLTYSSLGKLEESPDYIIFDEAHYMKNYSSSRSKSGKDIMDNCKGAVYATATPMDKAGHMHYMNKLGIFLNQTFSQAMSKLGYEYESKRIGKREIGSYVRQVPIADAVNRIEGFFTELEELGLMVKREVPMDEVDVSFHEIELPPEAHRELDKLESIYGDNPALMLMAQRRYQEPYKIPHVMKMVEEELAEKRQVVIFANRVNDSEIKNQTTGQVDLSSEGTIKKLIDALEKKGVKVARIFGDNDVSSEKAKFQSGACTVAIVTPEKGGAGLSLDDDQGIAPRTMIGITPPFSAQDQVQMAGRVNRLSTKSRSRIKYIFANTATDEWNKGIISEKLKVLHAAVKGGTEKLKIN